MLSLPVAFLALGIYVGNLWLSVPFGIATLAAAWSIVMAGRSYLAARRMSRRRAVDPSRDNSGTTGGVTA